MVTNLLKKVFGWPLATDPTIAEPVAEIPERRAHPRFEVRDASRIFVTRRPLSAVILDVSLGGARFAIRLARDVGAVVGLELVVDGHVRVLPLRIIWDRWNGSYFEHGGLFVELSADEEAHLRRYVAWAMENPPSEEHGSISETLVAKALEAVRSFTEPG